MKNILLIAFTFLTLSLSAATYYCAPTGSDSNPGTITQPFATWEKLASVLFPGDIGYVRGGTYRTIRTPAASAHCRINARSGTSTNYIKLWAYPGEAPIFDLSNIVATASSSIFGVIVENVSYWHIKGLRVCNFPQRFSTQNTFGWYITNGTGNIIEQCESDHNGYGFNFDKQVNCIIKNCDGHDNMDPYNPSPYDGSDGFGSNGGQPTNTSLHFIGCRAWGNCDDGWDLYRMEGYVDWENCWAFYNGYIPHTFTTAGNGNGFKMGRSDVAYTTEVKRIATRCVAWMNRAQGFDQNDEQAIIQLYNNTSWKNNIGYHMTYMSGLALKIVEKNNISFQDNTQATTLPSFIRQNNTWDAGYAAVAADFVSFDTTGARGARQLNGDLPVLPFLHLRPTSNLVDAGVMIPNLVFNGTAPDLGAFETGGSTPTNQPPIANAGNAQTINIPTSIANLTGSASSDPDGSIVSYTWSKLAGSPAGGTFSNANIVNPTVSSLQLGTYTFQLIVTDNGGATATSTVKITVVDPSPLNPVANAGPNQIITLPTNSVSVSGSSSSDPDGTIASYMWSKVSGGAATITTPGSVNTTITGLVQGVYVFQLTVTDQIGHTNSATMQVTVNQAANILPTSNAGVNQTITLPVTTASLSGSGSSDADGTITGYLWTFVSGPSTPVITASTSVNTNLTGLNTAGTYIFRLRVTDNRGGTATDDVNILVNPVPNTPPVANAGPNQTITLPTSTVTLNGSASSDVNGPIASYAWVKLSGTGGTITNPAGVVTNVTGLSAGTYQFRLTVTDGAGATNSATVNVTVNAAPNNNPIAVAGANQTITLPTSSVTVNGNGSSDPDGTIVTYAWTKQSGPAGGTITTPAGVSTTITALQQGTYVFRLTVTDNSAATNSDDITITVNQAPNVNPIANGGNDQSITLPTNSVSVNGGASTDPDGTIASYAWSKISGPVTFTITTPAVVSTTITGLVAGTYVFRLTVTDNRGGTATDDVQITVNPAPNRPPVANAGANQIINLPTTTGNLNGSGSSDPDGTISTYAWSKLAGSPTGGTISNAAIASPSLSALQLGKYTFQLIVADNSGARDTSIVNISVVDPSVLNPIADAGPQQTITLPTSTANLNGTGSADPDGSIASYAWTKLPVSPSGGNISNSAIASPSLSGLIEGTYFFKLVVTDAVGHTGTDTITIIVQPAPVNHPPVVDAGPDIVIELPVTSITINSTIKFQDGTITNYEWRRINFQPAVGQTVSTENIATPTDSTTNVTSLIAGSYVFRVKVTDNNNLIGFDYITVLVTDPVVPQPGTKPVGVAGYKKAF